MYDFVQWSLQQLGCRIVGLWNNLLEGGEIKFYSVGNLHEGFVRRQTSPQNDFSLRFCQTRWSSFIPPPPQSQDCRLQGLETSHWDYYTIIWELRGCVKNGLNCFWCYPVNLSGEKVIMFPGVIKGIVILSIFCLQTIKKTLSSPIE